VQTLTVKRLETLAGIRSQLAATAAELLSGHITMAARVPTLVTFAFLILLVQRGRKPVPTLTVKRLGIIAANLSP